MDIQAWKTACKEAYTHKRSKSTNDQGNKSTENKFKTLRITINGEEPKINHFVKPFYSPSNSNFPSIQDEDESKLKRVPTRSNVSRSTKYTSFYSTPFHRDKIDNRKTELDNYSEFHEFRLSTAMSPTDSRSSFYNFRPNSHNEELTSHTNYTFENESKKRNRHLKSSSMVNLRKNLDYTEDSNAENKFQKHLNEIYSQLTSPLKINHEDKESLLGRVLEHDDQRVIRHKIMIKTIDPTRLSHLKKHKRVELLDRIGTFGKFAFRSVDIDEKKDVQVFLDQMKYCREAKPTLTCVDLWSDTEYQKYLSCNDQGKDKRLIENYIIRHRPTVKQTSSQLKTRIFEKMNKEEKCLFATVKKEMTQSRINNLLVTPIRKKINVSVPVRVDRDIYHHIADTEYKNELQSLIQNLDKLEEENVKDYKDVLDREKMSKFKEKEQDKKEQIRFLKNRLLFLHKKRKSFGKKESKSRSKSPKKC